MTYLVRRPVIRLANDMIPPVSAAGGTR
jgi:hypothetical protein